MDYRLPSPKNPLRVGTRASPLALMQAHEVCLRLSAEFNMPNNSFQIIKIKTRGDSIINRPLSEIGGKGLFTTEIEDQLIRGGIDIAVHSMKDVPVKQPDGLLIDAYLPREDVRDAFLSFNNIPLEKLGIGEIVGTSSIRRQAQLLNYRNDLKVVSFRGNVQTRIKKLKKNMVSGTFLAMAGLNRLKVSNVPFYAIDVEQMLPAVAQGAIGVERRSGDLLSAYLLERINHLETEKCLMCERAYLRKLDGSCQTPIAGLAELQNGNIKFTAEIIKPDGSHRLKEMGVSLVEDAEDLGLELAGRLQSTAPSDFFYNLM